MAEKGKNGIVNKAWDFLASVRLAITLFILIVLTSIVDTVIKESVLPGESMQELARIFGEPAATEIYRLLEISGFTNVFHSHWFIGLLALLGANIIVCSISRLPGILKFVREPMQPLLNEKLDEVSLDNNLLLKEKYTEVTEKLENLLEREGFKIRVVEADGGHQFCAQKGAWSRLGVYVTHISLLVIMAGAIVTMFYSMNCFMYLKEGDASHVAVKFSLTGVTELVPLGFVVRNDSFEVDYYEKTDSPKALKSQLVVLKDDKEMKRKTVSVNDPLTFEGITFYQADYGIVPGSMRKGTFVFRSKSRNGQFSEVRLKPGSTLTIPGTSITGKVVNFSPALANDEKGDLYTYADRLQNPAVQMEFSEKGKKLYTHWIFKRYPETWKLPDGNQLEFLDYWGVEYTFLLVRKDAGIWIVYLGLIIMSAGLLIAFCFSHRRMWVRLAEEGEGTRVTIAASANKHQGALEKQVRKIMQELGA